MATRIANSNTLSYPEIEFSHILFQDRKEDTNLELESMPCIPYINVVVYSIILY
jgi:hypothetical protein